MDKTYNFNTLSDRARYCADLVGNPSRLATEAKMARSNVWRIIEDGADMTTESARRMAQVAGVNVGWLVSGEGAPHPETGKKERLITVRCFEDNSWCPVLFKEQYFLNSICENPLRCRAFEMVDQEIKNIHSGAWCIVDEQQRTGKNGYYLIEANEVDQVRILEFIPTGAIRIRSDKQFSEYTLNKDEVDAIQIKGRLVWWENRE